MSKYHPDLSTADLPRLYSLRTKLNRLVNETIPKIPKDRLRWSTFEETQACGTYRCLAGWDHYFDTGLPWSELGLAQWEEEWAYALTGSRRSSFVNNSVLRRLFGTARFGTLKQREALARRWLAECETRIAELECSQELTP